MESEDSASSIRGLGPNHDEDASTPHKLRKKSTHRLRIEFMNGKHLEVEYNFERTGIDEERIRINVNTLLPVFGRLLPPGTETFVDVEKLVTFVETYVHLNKCNDQRYASCPCHLDGDPETAAKFEPSPDNACAAGHFHHFCFQHVNYWLSGVLEPSIKLLGKGGSHIENRISSLNVILGAAIYFRDGEQMFRASRSHPRVREMSQ
ncbi:uncharacterized protein LOC124297944 [Neodiprion virginianus]|uniref:uncharacterized protein LOC124297944 n=1 Tax=Neodiprion virginianus TaxID=2961670 RepID=UPI001EE76004|nr:uncharacterized protein LOC124297944 [Neodiprion virginianus]